MTKNLVKRVWKILDESPCIRMNMNLDLINIRSLARYLIRERKINGKLDAVISAIRRYEPDAQKDIYDNARKIMAKTLTISTKSSMANISLTKDTEIQRLLSHLFSLVTFNHRDVLRIIHADESVNVIVDGKNLEKVRSLFPENKIKKIYNGIAEINIHMSPDARFTPAILAMISNSIAIEGINILEVMSCHPEWLWFVDEKDLSKVYNIITDILQKPSVH